jgi:hypothetical protein
VYSFQEEQKKEESQNIHHKGHKVARRKTKDLGLGNGWQELEDARG